MANNSGGIKVISKSPCPIETINEFNKRIVEIIVIKYPKEFIEKVIREYEKNN